MTKDGMDDWTSFQRTFILGLKDETIAQLGAKKDASFFRAWSGNSLGPKVDTIVDILRTDERLVLAGGWFASMYHNETPKDYDIFILCGPGVVGAHKIYKEFLPIIEEKYEYVNESYKHHNPNIWKVRKSTLRTETGAPVQFIFSKFTERKQIINDFDLVHTMVSYHLNTLYLSRDTYNAISSKSLIKNPKNTRVLQSWRIDKFVQRGWKNLTVS